MGGGVIQLLAVGAQDTFLTGNPQMSFFKSVYKRHTNFGIESIEQSFDHKLDWGTRATATIQRRADLIQQIYLEIVLPQMNDPFGKSDSDLYTKYYWVYGIGNAIVKKVEIEIGGQLIDSHYGDWMNIWSELSTPAGKRAGYDAMVGNLIIDNDQNGRLTTTKPHNLFVPLQFWFNRNPGLALPLISLISQEVKLNLELRHYTELLNFAPDYINSLDCRLFVDYIYLDTDERRQLGQLGQEYLIEQVQFTGEIIQPNDTYRIISLPFNNPVKELIWVHIGYIHSQTGYDVGQNNWFNYDGSSPKTNDTAESFQTALLTLNGHERFSTRKAEYFRKVQPYHSHTNIPRVGTDYLGGYNSNNPSYHSYIGPSDTGHRQFIYNYSFAVSPEEYQPSGTCNFTSVNNASLHLTYDKNVQTSLQDGPSILNIYATNYNILRFRSGRCDLLFSN
jgi:hypothetical protein